MSKAKAALIWIVDILDKYGIPYQVEGGVAANCYGSTRELVDIDIFIPSFGFETISKDVNGYVVFGPAFHSGTHWRLFYQILNYCGQQIEICDAGKAIYLDTQNNIWIKRDIDFTKAETIEIFGISTKVIPKDDLLEYKSRTNREVDIIDIEQIKDNE
jgi:hypothetical protein